MSDDAVSDTKVADSRRKFLKTAGKIAVYTPPAMLAVSRPSYATFKTSGGNTPQYFPGLTSKKKSIRKKGKKKVGKKVAKKKGFSPR